MAGQAQASEAPFWLILLTVAVYTGFSVAYATSIPSLGESSYSCGDSNFLGVPNGLDCLASALSFLSGLFGIIFFVLTLGAFSGTLPIIIQGPLLLLFSLGWGPFIVQGILNLAGAVIP